jgi:hypothetical protein
MLFIAFDRQAVPVYPNADMVSQKRAQGEIVISGDVIDFGTILDQPRKLTQYIEIVRTDHMTVFYPEIKEIADDEQMISISPNLMEEIDQHGLTVGWVGQIRTQMGV